MNKRKFVFFGGKGGVGKTTISSAFAHQCATNGDQTLLVSTDPAHSTSDVFEQKFGDSPQVVTGYESLHAMEIDPDKEVDQHLRRLKRELGTQMSPTMVNEIDIQLEMAHQTPGAYEAALFDRFISVMRKADQYSQVVFDTSPTGGTLRLLALPELLEGWIERLIAKRKQSLKLYEMAAIGKRTPRRVAEGDPILARLEERREKFELAGNILRNESVFILVMNPDSLSFQETQRAIETLSESGLSVGGIIVNKVTPQPDSHEEGRGAEYLRARRESELQQLRNVRETLEVPVHATIESRTGDVKGDTLDEVGENLSREKIVSTDNQQTA